VLPSVLLVSEELAFLLTAYSSLQRDPRIGRIEASAGHDEAIALMRTMRPNVVVLDVTASDPGQAMVGQFRRFDTTLIVFITFREHDQDAIMAVASTLGAHDICPREAFTVERVVRVTQALTARRTATARAAAAGAAAELAAATR